MKEQKYIANAGIISNMNLLNLIGKDRLGEAYLSTKKSERNGKFYITKIIRRDQLSSIEYEKLRKEIKILKELNHPNIYKLEEDTTNPKYYFLIMDYFNGGCLSDCLEQ